MAKDNIANSAPESDGDLRIVFHRGAFLEQGAVRRAARNAAHVVNDLQSDAIESFVRSGPLDCLLNSYAPFPVRPWMPLGNTGVIRRAERNADIVAEAAVKLLAIPQEIFSKYWHWPYTPEELRPIFPSTA